MTAVGLLPIAVAGIDIDEFAELMFKAGTSLNGKSAAEVFSQDFKTVEIQGYTVGISQVTVMGLSDIDNIKADLFAHMKKVAAGDTYDLLVVIFVDLGSGTTTLHFVGNLSEEVAADLGGVKHSDEFVYNNINIFFCSNLANKVAKWECCCRIHFNKPSRH